jgi:hypothetical protein
VNDLKRDITHAVHLRVARRTTSVALAVCATCALLSCGAGTTRPAHNVATRPVPATQYSDLPRPIKSFVRLARRGGRAEVDAISREYHEHATFAFRFLYAIHVPDRDIWVVAYSVGTYPGQGLLPINRTCIVDEHGRLMREFNEQYAGDYGVLFGSPGQRLL